MDAREDLPRLVETPRCARAECFERIAARPVDSGDAENMKRRVRLRCKSTPRDFGGEPFSYALYGAPVVGAEVAGSRSSVYRFHLDNPIPFARSIKATIEHGHANVRSDNFYSVAYWYQAEPHAAFPALPPVNDRLPMLVPVGGPGSTSPSGR